MDVNPPKAQNTFILGHWGSDDDYIEVHGLFWPFGIHTFGFAIV